MAEQTRLASVLDDWLRRQRVTVAHLAKYSGVARNTIWLIQQGTTTTPAIQTLRKLARALATDPNDGSVNQDDYAEALHDLSEAAGVSESADDLPKPTLESMIRSKGVKSPKRAASLAAFIEKYPNMSADQRRLVDALIDHLGDE